MNNIKHVYFDVGGVALIDFSGNNKWTEMKRELGVASHQDEIFDVIWRKHMNRFCLDLDIDHVIPEFESGLGTKFVDNYSMLADFVNRFEKNQSIWPVIQSAKEKYSIGLLTNMYPRMLDIINANNLIPQIDWDAVVDSSVVGFQKPDEGIYDIAEEMVGVKPESIYFIDNSIDNVEAAKKRGWHATLYDPQNPEDSSKEVAKELGLSIKQRIK